MLLIGLTGSIGMGKSTTAEIFSQFDIPTFDADKSVHDIYKNEGIEALRPYFPDAILDNKIDRQILSKIILEDPNSLKKIEALIHPLVRKRKVDFIEKSKQQGHKAVIIDSPLLFETNHHKDMDKVIVVTCSPELQRQRVLSRPNMTEEKLNSILAKQIPDGKKRKMADYIIDTSQSLADAKRQVVEILGNLNLISRKES